MNTSGPPAHEPPAGMPIGDLAARVGLTPATLRTWEVRHGFPRPRRAGGGHRRYDQRDVDLVRQVLRRREAGVRLGAAIAETLAASEKHTESLFADVRSLQPHLAPQTLTKATLLALTRAVEDECCARAERPVLFASFQHGRFFVRSRPRWEELARTARAAVVFADWPHGGDAEETTRATGAGTGLHRVQLPPAAPMLREWLLVCDAPDHPACIVAFELPGQLGDDRRLFETLWTLDPRVVRETSRSCARLAGSLGSPAAAPLLAELAATPRAGSTDLARATGLLARMVSYVDGARS